MLYTVFHFYALFLAEISSKGEKSQRNQFEVLFGKRQTDDGNCHNNPMQKMGYGDFPAKKNCPENIENHVERPACILHFDNFAPKGSHRGDS